MIIYFLEVDQKRLSEALKFLPKEEVEAKNRYALNAIVDNKPFWLVGDPYVFIVESLNLKTISEWFQKMKRKHMLMQKCCQT